MARPFGRIRRLLKRLVQFAEDRQEERRIEAQEQARQRLERSRKRKERQIERLKASEYEAQLERDRLNRLRRNERARQERVEREEQARIAREQRELELESRAERTATHPRITNDRWHRWFRNYSFAQMSEQDEYSADSGGLQRHAEHFTHETLENIDDSSSELGWNTDDLEMLFRAGFTTRGPDHRRSMARALYFTYLEELGYGRDDFNWWLWREEMGYPHGDRVA